MVKYIFKAVFILFLIKYEEGNLLVEASCLPFLERCQNVSCVPVSCRSNQILHIFKENCNCCPVCITLLSKNYFCLIIV